MQVYGGKCRLCDTGIPAKFTDMCGSPLATGDIVIIFTVVERDDGEWCDYCPDGLTVVVNNQYSHTPEGAPLPEGQATLEPFVMGIKTALMAEPGQWRVLKVKSHKDVIDGEHWPDYGFSYKATPA